MQAMNTGIPSSERWSFEGKRGSKARCSLRFVTRTPLPFCVTSVAEKRSALKELEKFVMSLSFLLVLKWCLLFLLISLSLHTQSEKVNEQRMDRVFICSCYFACYFVRWRQKREERGKETTRLATDFGPFILRATHDVSIRCLIFRFLSSSTHSVSHSVTPSLLPYKSSLMSSFMIPDSGFVSTTRMRMKGEE